MNNLVKYIYEAQENNLASDIQNKIEENPKTVDMMSIEESPIDWKKISRLKPEKFSNLFKDKTILLYVPVGGIGSFGDGSFIEKAKEKSKKWGGGYWPWESTAIFITDIDENTCKVYSANPSGNDLITSSHQVVRDKSYKGFGSPNFIDLKKLEIQQVLNQIKGLSLAAFNKSKTQSKVFIIDEPHLNMKDKSVVDNFFKPIRDAQQKLHSLYSEMINELKEFVSSKKCKRIEKLRELRKNSTWNYVTWENGTFWIVGYGEGIAIDTNYSGNVEIKRPYTISISQAIGGDSYRENPDRGGYKVTGQQYDKLAAIVAKYEKEIDKYNNAASKVWNEWIKKYVMGETFDPEYLIKKEEEKIEKESEKTPEENNNPESGSEKVKISKKALATAEAKMDAWHEGTRKQNLKNCSDAKLKMNYQICKDKGYEAECKAIEVEAKSRGLELSTNESLIDIAYMVND